MRDVVRVAVAGSVDDGKSTLLGRLLSDSERVASDEAEAVARASGGAVNLAFFTDGLVTEREKGITLDVAWRHLVLGGKRLLLADVPGHAELMRNMATGASVADAAVLLVDAQRGVQTQTRRHLVMLSGLGVSRVIICLNKLDAVGFDERVARELEATLSPLGRALGLSLEFIPVSALEGDNVVHSSTRCRWYSGPTLAARLTSLEPTRELNAPRRAVVQLDGDVHGWTAVHRLGGAALRAGDVFYAGTTRVEVLERTALGAVRLSVASLRRGMLLTAQPVASTRAATMELTWIAAVSARTEGPFELLQHGTLTPVSLSRPWRRRSLERGPSSCCSTAR